MDPVRPRIWDAAGGLFSAGESAATSLHQITAEAGVNLAAMNYPFGSKENPHLEWMAQALAPLHTRRVELLDADKSAASPPPATVAAIEAIGEAWGGPCCELSRHPANESTVCLWAKSWHENEQHMRILMERVCCLIVDCFFTALHQTTQGLCGLLDPDTTQAHWGVFSAADQHAAAAGAS